MTISKNTQKFLDSIDEDEFNLTNYIDKNLDIKKLEKILRDLSKEYYNTGESLVSDEVYDLLKEKLEDLDPNNEFLNEVGAPIDSKEKVKLPYSMGSLDKIKPSTEELQKWKKKYKGPYIVSDKLDGISGQLYITKDDNKLYTRGDGEYGQDISHLIKYLIDVDYLEKNKKNMKLPISIRGELIISRDNFKKVDKNFKNARNAVAGYVNSKKVDKKLSEIVEFIGYTVIEPRLNILDQMKYLTAFKALKKVVNYKKYKYEELTNENLSEVLIDRRKNGDYEVDGIVVFDSEEIYEHQSGNPEYGFAFKTIMSDQCAEAIVVDVLWEASMNSYLKPTVQIKPINLVGVTITYATAFHAKFVEENKLGPGSVIKIVRSGDVIPDIQEVLKPSSSGKPKMPDEEYIWDKNHVNIMIKNINKSKYLNVVKAKKIEHFFSTIDVKNLGLGIITKLVDNGYDNVIAILNADKDDLTEIDGIGKKMIEKIYNNIDTVMETITLEKLMAGSHVFGIGVGERKLKQLIKEIPNILEYDDDNELKNDILKVEGFSDITADKFVDNLDKFKIFYGELKEIYDLDHIKKSSSKKPKAEKKKLIFKDEKIVFTGFRDKELQDKIESLGGKVSTSVSSKTTLVIYADNDKTSSKVKKAEDLGINLMTKSSFLNKFRL